MQIEVDTTEGVQTFEGETLGDLGIIETQGWWIFVHLPTGFVLANWLLKTREDAMKVLQEATKLRNSFDVTIEKLEEIWEVLEPLLSSVGVRNENPSLNDEPHYNRNGYSGDPL